MISDPSARRRNVGHAGQSHAEHGRRGRLGKRGKLALSLMVGAAVVAGSRIVELGVEEGVGAVGSSPTDEAPLFVNSSFPDDPDACGGLAELAMPLGGPAPSAFTVEEDGSKRKDLFASGALAFRHGNLKLELTAPRNSVYIAGIDVQLFSRGQSRPAWVLNKEGGCGEAYQRVFYADLDQQVPRLVDGGIQGQGGPAEYPAIPKNPFGRTFSVTPETPAVLTVLATACDQSVAWGVRIRYVDRGREDVLTVGTPEAPLQILAGSAPAYDDGIITGGFDGSLHPVGMSREYCYKAAPETYD